MTTFTLSMCGLGFVLIPGTLERITNTMPLGVSVLVGGSLYAIGLANQSAIFISYKTVLQRLINFLVIVSLGGLIILYLRTRLLADSLILAGLFIGQLYLFTLQKQWREHRKMFFLPFYAALFIYVTVMLALRLDTGIGYHIIEKCRYWLASFSALGCLSSLAAFYFSKKNNQLSIHFYQLTSLPWIIWGLHALSTNQISTIPVTTGLVLIPLVTNVISWNKVLISDSDLVSRKTLQISNIAESLMLIALVAAEYYTQQINSITLFFSQVSSAIKPQTFSFVVMLIVKLFSLFALITIAFTMRFLTARSGEEQEEEGRNVYKGWHQWLARFLRSTTLSSYSLHIQLDIQEEQIKALTHQLENEKKRTVQLSLLAELSHQLETQLDHPVSAQLAVNTLQRALKCQHVAIFENDVERREFSPLAAAGTFLPPEYRQNTSKGLLGRTLRLRKTQISNDVIKDTDFIQLETSNFRSAFAIPLVHHGHVQAVLEVGDDKFNAFSLKDVHLAEMTAAELIRAWERSKYHRRITSLLKAGISLFPLLEPQNTIQEVASIAREILQARFVFVMLVDQENNVSRSASSGSATRLLNSLNQKPAKDSTVQAALHAHESFRIRDVRKYRKASHIEIDHPGLRSLLAIPIRLHRLSIGTILAFGKQREIFFSESDESLANLLSSQAGTAIEATWLYQELRSTLRNTSQLYNLSVKILQSGGLQQAAMHIAETAAKVSSATEVGIILFSKDQEIEAGMIVDESGVHPGQEHPLDLVEQTLESGQTVHVTTDQVSATICFPLQTHLRKYGALWLEVPKIQEYFAHHDSNMQTLANQAILALERSILLNESQQQAEAIELAYEELEKTYDQTLTALMSSLDARDRETEGHSIRVSELACRLGIEFGMDEQALKALERGSLLHDIGKIGISDTILHKPGKLNEEEWKIMRTHPDIGAWIVEEIPFLQDTLPIIRYHQERWDGSGYPVGLSGKDIPLLARIFAVVDAFDALISDRPYRKSIPSCEAMEYIREQAGGLFDPQVVTTFEKLWVQNKLDELLL